MKVVASWLARSAATLLEVGGIAAAAVGVGVALGAGAGLVVGGVGALVAGVALDVSKARQA